jgi:hypothetical protein
MKQSTAKFLCNAAIATALEFIAAAILATCRNYWLPTLAASLLSWLGVVWIGCAAMAKWRSCRQLAGYDEPLNLQYDPLPLDCPPAPCCCDSQPYSGNRDQDDHEVGCDEIVRCEL